MVAKVADDSKTIVLITGANTEIGYEAVKLLLKASPKYDIIIGSRSLERGQAAVKRLQNEVDSLYHDHLDIVQIGITDDSSIFAAAAAVEKKYGLLDVFVKNAVIAFAPKNGACKNDEMRQELATNVIRPIFTTQKFAPLLRKSADARLVFVTTGVASFGVASDPTNPFSYPGAMGYKSSKAAVNMVMVETMKWLGKNGVKVWAVCPGWCATTLGNEDAEEKKKMGAKLPEEGASATVEVVEGKRDADVGKVVHNEQPGGLRPW